MISLIMATVGRQGEIALFLDSLDRQICQDFELIIVDQNPRGYLDDVLSAERKFPIKHILSAAKGLSKNRNIGIENARGQILAFPDDDCVYYPNTIACVIDSFNENPKANMLLGRIYDRGSDLDIIKKWPKAVFHVQRRQIYSVASSITIFSKKNGITFDELLGAGALYPSNEDFDYIARSYEIYKSALYSPFIEVWHPHQTYKNIPIDKAYSYGRGFGRCSKKLYALSPYYGVLFLVAVMYHACSMILGAITADAMRAKYSHSAFLGRIRGWRES